MIADAAEFKRLRESSDPEEYRQAAMGEASIEVWNEIIETMPELRFWVTQNKTVPSVILERLARCEDVNVRVMVAMKKKITEPIALLLVADSDETVRAALVGNSKIPAEVLEFLRNDRSALVKEALETHHRNCR